MSLEWKPSEGFNLLDTRNTQNFPQFSTPPYVLKFQFSDPVVFHALSLYVMGWNIPECRTDTLFSKVQVSKNGWDDLYYNKPAKNLSDPLVFRNDMALTSKDTLFLTLFPLCPAHMVHVDRVVFLPPTNTTPPPKPLPPATADDQNNNAATPDYPTGNNTESTNTFFSETYWYLYATVFVMVILLMLSLLFRALRPKATYRLVPHKPAPCP